MWECSKCGVQVEANFDVCWKCGTSREGEVDPNFRIADDIAGDETDISSAQDADSVIRESTAIRVAREEKPSKRPDLESPPFYCLRCGRPLHYVGTKSFHEGFQWGGLLGDLGEFFVNQESFDMYVCRRCGRVDFYLSGLGEDLRPSKSDG